MRDTDTLIGALSKRPEVRDLTAVSNNVGSGDMGLGEFCLPLSLSIRLTNIQRPGKLLYSGHIDKMMASYIGGYVTYIPLLNLGTKSDTNYRTETNTSNPST